MNLYKDNWKWYLISILSFLGLIALADVLDINTIVLVISGFLIMGIVSYLLGRKRIQ